MAHDSVSVGRHLGVVCDERNQCILLAMGQLAEALEQFALMQRKLGAVQAHAQLFTQSAFLNEALLKAGNDFRVHAAVVITSYFCNALAHSVG